MASLLKGLDRATQDWIQTTRDQADTWVKVSTLDGKTLYDDAASAAILGHPLEELEGDSGYALVHPDDVPALTQYHQMVLTSRAAGLGILFRGWHAQGEWVWLQAETRLVSLQHQDRQVLLSLARRPLEEPTTADIIDLAGPADS